MVAAGRSSDQARLSVSYAVAPATAPKESPQLPSPPLRPLFIIIFLVFHLQGPSI